MKESLCILYVNRLFMSNVFVSSDFPQLHPGNEKLTQVLPIRNHFFFLKVLFCCVMVEKPYFPIKRKKKEKKVLNHLDQRIRNKEVTFE